MLDLRQIQYFVCLHEERSVTRAARQLNVVQPALSMQINRLERRLGLTLFDRTARGMIPTAAGEAMYRLYVPILLDPEKRQPARHGVERQGARQNRRRHHTVDH